jgi:hypothetical protein
MMMMIKRVLPPRGDERCHYDMNHVFHDVARPDKAHEQTSIRDDSGGRSWAMTKWAMLKMVDHA